VLDFELLRPDPAGSILRFSPADLAFVVQKPLVTSKAKKIIAVLPRQAGKTTSAVLFTFQIGQQEHTRNIVYFTKTRKNGKRLFWRPLLEYAKKLGLDVDGLANHGELTFKIPHDDGSYCLVEIMGAHDQEQVELLRGGTYDAVIGDEFQLIRASIAESLLTEILPACLRRRQGVLLLVGTPGPVRLGPFYERLEGSLKDQWEHHYWTAWDIIADLQRIDPTFPADAIDKEIADLGLKPTDARYVTEYLGKYYDGYDERRVWEVDPARDACGITLPTSAHDPAFKTWRFSWGVDLASSQDSDALVVLGWDTTDPLKACYEVDSWEQPGTSTVDDLEKVLRQKRDQWRPLVSMGDDGGHGAKKIFNTLGPRLGIRFEHKGQLSVEATVRLINTDFRLGRCKVRRGGALADDLLMETWEVNERTGKRTIGGDRHSDLTAAFRYAFAAAQHFRSQPLPEGPRNNEEKAQQIWNDYDARRAANHGRSARR
jgi:hypothetical protein